MTLFNIFLILHVAAGATGLLTGLGSLLVQKGGANHVKSGILFYFAMLTVAVSSFILSVMHPNPFLFAIGVFTGYMTLTGRRYLTQKQKGLVNQTDNFEKILAMIMLVFSIGFILFGGYLIIKEQYFGSVFVFFGFISLRMVREDFNVIAQKMTAPTLWLRMHITRMTGAWIAAFTAFVVVNNTKITDLFPSNLSLLLNILMWVLPGVVGTFFIIYWLRKMKV
jgi:hypothetical protein